MSSPQQNPTSLHPSPTATVTDLAAGPSKEKLATSPTSTAPPSIREPASMSPAHTSASEQPFAYETPIARVFSDNERKVEGATSEPKPGAAVKMSQRKKWWLLVVFSLAFFIDVWSYSAFFVFTDPIASSLGVKFEQQSWIITSYAVTFAAFLLFWGRVSDLYSAKPVFSYGFLALGVLNLIISFLPDLYSFFVLRAVAGIAGAALIPAAFRLIVAVFEPHELGKAFTLYGMSGALANTSGIIIAGFVEYIPGTGQMTAWRWFFRILAILVIPVSIGSFYWIPKPSGAMTHVESKWKRLDLPGAFLMLSGIIMLILGLTLGASYGFKTAKFLVPFLLAWPLLVSFFVWEAKLPADYAILPASTWKIPNFWVFIVFALYIYSWWSTNFLVLVETYLVTHHERAIIAAVRLLPQGVSAGLVTVLLTLLPKLVARPRWTLVIGMLLSITGMVLLIQGRQVGDDYWRYQFTGGIIGSGGMMAVFTGTNVGVMTSVPAEMSGVAGATLQIALQAGSAVALSIQAGLLTVNPGSIENWLNVQTSLYFVIGWGIVWLIGFLIFYRPGKTPTAEGQAEEGEKVVAHF